MIGRTYQFLEKVGCLPSCLRFRQHMAKEMAHYASDCWDAEALTSYGWLEIVGIANRAAFDLNAHSKAAKVDLQVRETLPEAIEIETLTLTKASKTTIQKNLKSKPLIEAIEELSISKLEALQKQADAKEEISFTVPCTKETFVLKPEWLITERKVKKTNTVAYTPGVIEPSFGVDRILFTVFEHTYTRRPGQEVVEGKEDQVLNQIND